MRDLHRTVFSLALSVAAIVVITSSAKSQTGGVTVGASRGPHPAWEGKAAGDVVSRGPMDDDIKTSLLSRPVPDVWLEFVESQREGRPPRRPSETKEEVIKVTLPAEAKAIVKSLWEEGLKFDYAEAFEKAETAKEGVKRDLALISYFARSAEKLRKIEVEAPDGKRPISDKEADEILGFVRKASSNLVKEAKQL